MLLNNKKGDKKNIFIDHRHKNVIQSLLKNVHFRKLPDN